MIALLFSLLTWASAAPVTRCESAIAAPVERNPLEKEWDAATVKREAIAAFVATLSGSEKAYFETIGEGVGAALGKHHDVYTRERYLHHLDLPRHLRILRAIAAFDPARARFSLYDVKRAIEGRHSLNEYIQCKE